MKMALGGWSGYRVEFRRDKEAREELRVEKKKKSSKAWGGGI